MAPESRDPAPEDIITILDADIENFQRITLAQLRNLPDSGLIALVGKNRQGKSTIIRGVRELFCGNSAVPSDPINDDAEDGKGGVMVRLNNGFRIARSHTEKHPKGYLTVKSEDGGTYGQSKIAEWVGPLGFDPFALFDQKQERIAEIILSLSPDKDLPKKLQVIRELRRETYDERTVYLSAKRRLKAYPRPEGERPELVDVTQTSGKLRGLNQAQRDREQIRSQGQAITRDIESTDIKIANTDNKIDELKRQIEELEEENQSRQELVKTLMAEREALLVEYEETPDPSEEIAELEGKLNSADRVREALKPWEAYDRAMEELEEATEKAGELTGILEGIGEDEELLLAGADIPISNVSFDDEGGLLINGHPIESASGEEQVTMATEVAFALNPKLRLCLLDAKHFGELDDDAVLRLHNKALEKKFQVLVCKVHEGGPGVEIIVKDGVAQYGDVGPDEEES